MTLLLTQRKMLQKNESEPEQTVFNVGDTVNLNDVEITLVNNHRICQIEIYYPDRGNEFLILEFGVQTTHQKISASAP